MARERSARPRCSNLSHVHDMPQRSLGLVDPHLAFRHHVARIRSPLHIASADGGGFRLSLAVPGAHDCPAVAWRGTGSVYIRTDKA